MQGARERASSGATTNERVLITGGAGFIGSHLADALLARGYQVRVLDNLEDQVHGHLPDGRHARPDYLHPDVELLRGDVRDPDAVSRALAGVHSVFHLAAAVGVGQSMYEIARYTDVNNLGTAVLLEGLLRNPVRRLIVASSMSVYGEGLYRLPGGGLVTPPPRAAGLLRGAQWELRTTGGEVLEPVPTTEDKTPMPESVYALSKYDQEKLCLIFGRAYDVPVVALRFFNVYGERQALSNPYTGVLAIFAARLLNGRPPQIFEDGRQRRDFVHVRDLARACVGALENGQVRDAVFNVGSGTSYTITEIAERLATVMNMAHIVPEITGRYRAGDIRHCFADTAAMQQAFGFRPEIGLDDGLAELATWLAHQQGEDRTERAAAELAKRGLVA